MSLIERIPCLPPLTKLKCLGIRMSGSASRVSSRHPILSAYRAVSRWGYWAIRLSSCLPSNAPGQNIKILSTWNPKIHNRVRSIKYTKWRLPIFSSSSRRLLLRRPLICARSARAPATFLLSRTATFSKISSRATTTRCLSMNLSTLLFPRRQSQWPTSWPTPWA